MRSPGSSIIRVRDGARLRRSGALLARKLAWESTLGARKGWVDGDGFAVGRDRGLDVAFALFDDADAMERTVLRWRAGRRRSTCEEAYHEGHTGADPYPSQEHRARSGFVEPSSSSTCEVRRRPRQRARDRAREACGDEEDGHQRSEGGDRERHFRARRFTPPKCERDPRRRRPTAPPFRGGSRRRRDQRLRQRSDSTCCESYCPNTNRAFARKSPTARNGSRAISSARSGLRPVSIRVRGTERQDAFSPRTARTASRCASSRSGLGLRARRADARSRRSLPGPFPT